MRSHRRGGDPWERFLEKCDRSGECWIWLCQRKSDGYGHFKVDGRYVGAHRYAYQRVNGAIPSGMEIDHLCRNRSCVNPTHLEAVPHSVNVKRGHNGAHNKNKTHCVNGHPFDDVNTRITRHGHRSCRACHRAAVRAHRVAVSEGRPIQFKWQAECKRGHAFDAANTYINTKGFRTCRECNRIARRRHRAAEVSYAASIS